jgi:hypothetical protein
MSKHAATLIVLMLTIILTPQFSLAKNVQRTERTMSKQTQPDKKRVQQIQTALREHGYAVSGGWPETQALLRQIAKDHGWQTHRAPDARVLILLDLGNLNSNSWVAEQGRNHLDGAE